MQTIREVLGLGKDVLTVIIVVIGVYSGLSSRPGKVAAPGADAAGGAKLGFEIPGIGSIFWKRA